MGLSAEAKLRTLAQTYAPLTALIGSGAAIRWYDTQLPQNQALPNITVLRVATSRLYVQQGISELSQVRLQFDCRAIPPDTARQVAARLIDFLGTVDLAGDYQFGSPVVTPPQFPCFIIGQRMSMDPNVNPPVPVAMVDARIFNKEEF